MTPDEAPVRRQQKVGVLRRNGLFWAGSTAWVDRIELAKMLPIKQLRDAARIEIGMPCELVHVMPMAIPHIEVEIVGEDVEKTFTPKRPAARVRRYR